jgi:dGTPase
MPMIRDIRDQRRSDRTGGDEGDTRSPAARDRDRVLYSSSFRRLAGVTQVAAVDEKHLLHNRLTHSLKVAQLGRRIAECLRARPSMESVDWLDPDVVEAAGLIHDLGHPPFGHVAEEKLNQLMDGYGGFEGNAQSFRIITKLAVKDADGFGLDLTRATLDATLKYPLCFECRDRDKPSPWTDRSRGAKWGVYRSEFRILCWARERYCSVGGRAEVCHDPAAPIPDRPSRTALPRPQRSAEAILVDWADDVSYATHDLEDYYRAQLIPLHDLDSSRADFLSYVSSKLGQKYGGSFSSGLLSEAIDRLGRESPNGAFRRPFQGNRSERAELRKLVSDRIGKYANAVQVTGSEPFLKVEEDSQYEVEALKYLTWFYVIDRPGLALSQQGQKSLIHQLFEYLGELLQDPARRAVPDGLRELYDLNLQDGDLQANYDANIVATVKRTACDYLASLTEAQAIDLHSRLSGVSSNTSMFGTWF